MCTTWRSLIFIKPCPCPELICRIFFRNQSYGEISTPAGSWGTGAFFEEQIATTGRLCAKLSHHPSTRNFKKRSFPFSLFPFFFSPISSQRGKWLFAGRLSLFPFQSHCLSAWIDALPVHLWPAALNAWSAWNTDDFHRVVLWLGSVEKCRRCYWLVLVHIWFILVLYMFGRYSKFKRVIHAGTTGTSTTYNSCRFEFMKPQKWDQVRSKCCIHRSDEHPRRCCLVPLKRTTEMPSQCQ